MSEQIKENCVKLIGLIDELESCLNKLDNITPQDSQGFYANSVDRTRRIMKGISRAPGNFRTNWCEGDNIVCIEKMNYTNYLITLNPSKILFKIDQYSPEFNFTEVDVLKTGPWIERFEKFVENKIKEVDSYIETIIKMEHDNKYGEIDF